MNIVSRLANQDPMKTPNVIQHDPEERRQIAEALAALPYTPPDPETRRQTREYTRKLARESNECSLPEYRLPHDELEAMLDKIDAMFDRLEEERATAEPSLSVHPGILPAV